MWKRVDDGKYKMNGMSTRERIEKRMNEPNIKSYYIYKH